MISETPSRFDRQTQLLKILTHPARLAILAILRDGEQCVCHMEAHLGLRQAYISQQLAVLRGAGLIEDRRDGWNVYYRVSNLQIFQVLDAVATVTGDANQEAGNRVVCPCPRCSA